MNRNTNLSIPFFKPHLGRKEIAAVKRIIRNGWLTTGPEVVAFEEEFASLLQACCSHEKLWAIAVNSATAGLHLALEALGIGPGDKVAVPSLTFTASAAIIRYLGAEPVFIDSLPDSGNMDPEGLYKVNKDINTVIPVHLNGRPCDMRDIRQAVSDSTFIVEDAAHAFPSRTDEGMTGSLGDIGVFSFYATKTITTGEGGMIVCKDPKIRNRIKIMRIHGIDRAVWTRYSAQAGMHSWKYDVVAPGFKYNLTDLAASIGRVQLAKADHLLTIRKNLAARYTSALAGTNGLELPEDTEGHAWHLYMLKLKSGVQRDRLTERLHHEGIGTSVHFIPLHRMTYWKKTCNLDAGNFPVADDLADRILSIPLWPGLKKSEQNRIITIIRDELHE